MAIFETDWQSFLSRDSEIPPDVFFAVDDSGDDSICSIELIDLLHRADRGTQDLLGRGEPGLQRHVLRTNEGGEGGDRDQRDHS